MNEIEKREQTTQQLQPYIHKINNYKIILANDAIHILGREKYFKLCNDKIKGLGPIKDTFYWWNVLDYMCLS